MTRQTDGRNQIWFEKEGQVTNVGFTREFLTTLDQCWHILPANMERFREKAPMLTIETNDALISILSPVSGNFMEFSQKAQDFPNKLTEQDVVLRVTDEARRRQPARMEPEFMQDAPAMPPRDQAFRVDHQLREQAQEAVQLAGQPRMTRTNAARELAEWAVGNANIGRVRNER